MLKLASRILQGLFYIVAGINHFRRPKFYLRIMPSYIPNPELANAASGVAEVLLGMALLIPIPSVSRWAAWGIIALLIAVFPANVYMLTNERASMNMPLWARVVRLPFQLVFVAWAYWHTQPEAGHITG